MSSRYSIESSSARAYSEQVRVSAPLAAGCAVRVSAARINVIVCCANDFIFMALILLQVLLLGVLAAAVDGALCFVVIAFSTWCRPAGGASVYGAARMRPACLRLQVKYRLGKKPLPALYNYILL
ncbi:unnamed protein product [Pieris brassicae]|uniref:Uncharacterized protein n=1 Tax=Pieris brassicae TaxID=7116 RepID=A0A9P0SSJ1_PIEBR|nr:unnamed protein product [Pieris brassicae]